MRLCVRCCGSAKHQLLHCFDLLHHEKAGGICAMQDGSWVVQGEIGSGVSGTVSRCINPHYPNVVVKKGNLLRLRKEAGMMRFLSHPNVARAYAVLASAEVSYLDGIMGYLALGRLGHSLHDMLQDPNNQ